MPKSSLWVGGGWWDWGWWGGVGGGAVRWGGWVCGGDGGDPFSRHAAMWLFHSNFIPIRKMKSNVSIAHLPKWVTSEVD